MRFLSGWRLVAFAAAMTSLILLPFAAAFAEKPQSVIDRGVDQGLQPAANEEDGPTKQIATYIRANYVWPFSSGPFYGSMTRAERHSPGVVNTAVGSFRLGAINLPTELATPNKLAIGPQRFIVQLHLDALRDGAFDELQSRLAASGSTLVGGMGRGTYVATLNGIGHAALQGLPGLVGMEPYQAGFKLDPTIGRVPLNDPYKALSEVYSLDVRLFDGANAQLAARAIADLGGQVTVVRPDSILVDLHRSKLAALAQLDSVSFVSEDLPIYPHGGESSALIQAGRHGGVPLSPLVPYRDAGIDGTGQVLMVLDSGIQVDAGDLSETRTTMGTVGGSHRKVLRYDATSCCGHLGTGDNLGCDANASGAFTHGHTVSAMALGRATDVEVAYGGGYTAPDNTVPTAIQWSLDGVAPGAKLIAWDAQVTPAAVSCADPLVDTITPGTLYVAGSGVLQDSYDDTPGAKIYNFSWGADNNVYSGNAIQVDNFLHDKEDAMVFISAGNAGQDADNDDVPDLNSLGNPATTKNGLAIGASGDANDLGGATAAPESRAAFSSTGPAVNNTSVNRIAPQLMGPGQERGSMGVDSAFACLTDDNESDTDVACDVSAGAAGTSFAAPSVAGAALIVRDWFEEGFYPDGTDQNSGNGTDVKSNISGALVKAALVASADFMNCSGLDDDIDDAEDEGPCPFTANLTYDYRFNNQQGYGRVQLDNALRLETWPESPSGVIVQDGGITAGNFGDLSGLNSTINALAGGSVSESFVVCDDTQELRVALAWLEDVDGGNVGNLVNDLDLTLISPTGEVYWGNYFTDDDNRNGSTTPDAGEDCDGVDGASGVRDAAEWSLPTCANSDRDTENPTEAIFLSPDYDRDGAAGCTPGVGLTCTDGNFADDNQIEIGTWKIVVSSPGGGMDTTQQFAVFMSGGVCIGSSVRFNAGAYVCNDTATITVNDTDEAGTDPASGLTPGEISGRVTVDVCSVKDCSGGSDPLDTETGINFTQSAGGGLSWTSDELALSDGTNYDAGNGVLDVGSGDVLRVRYADETSGSPDGNKLRTSTSQVSCGVNISFGGVTFGQFGQDTGTFINGGCERNLRGLFEFGFPDRYMDAGENIIYNFAFASTEAGDLNNVQVGLRCVEPDGDSPASCRPGTSDCNDPNRENNDSCDGVDPDGAGPAGVGTKLMTISNSPVTIGFVPSGVAVAANFNIQMEASIAGEPDVEMVLEVAAPSSGKSAKGVAVSQHTLDVDEVSTFYSTDFPGGGTEFVDWNNNEFIENPTNNIGDFQQDYRFETRSWTEITATGTKNLSLKSPWNFDTNDGGFTTGIGASTDDESISQIIAQWGEDKDFDNILTRRCVNFPNISCAPMAKACPTPGGGGCVDFEDRDTSGTTSVLDQNWSTAGGCGWMTRAPGVCTDGTDVGCHITADCVGEGLTGPCNTGGGGQATGGAWHTGTIGPPKASGAADCFYAGAGPGGCQSFETVGGDTGQLLWFEILTTPEIQKVGGASSTIEITHMGWNQLVDLPDSNVYWTWEVDTDLDKLEPTDLKADLSLLNFGSGGYGAVTGESNPSLTNGWPLFAPVLAGVSQWGTDTQGNNRVGRNSCFFEGSAISAVNLLTQGLSHPEDDDIDQRYCQDFPNTKCTVVQDCIDVGGVGPCTAPDGTIDNYVTDAGPRRNAELFDFNGPDMRFSTLEDIYGDTGERFQAAIGILNFEKVDSNASDPQTGFGVAVDDPVIEWREFTLDTDQTDCTTGGQCATLDLETSTLFEGSAILKISLLDATHDGDTDCSCGTIPGTGQNYICDGVNDGVDDCDGDSKKDVKIKVNSESEVEGEYFLLEETSAGSGEYTGQISISSTYDVPGTLFIQAVGTDNPTITAEYLDLDDTPGGGNTICKNDINPDAQGLIRAVTGVALQSGDMFVVSTQLTDNGDNDGWADGNETVSMKINVSNKSTGALSNVVARLATNSPNIDCIFDAVINVATSIPKDGTVLSSEAFSFHVADVDRTNLGLNSLDDLSADFTVILSSDEFDSAISPQQVTLDLDLDATGGSGPTTFLEDFEGSGLGSFTPMDLDFNKANLTASDGYRCSYSDPDWINSNSYGTDSANTCWIGVTPTQSQSYFWQIDNASATGQFLNNEHAYTNDSSLYFGIFGAAAGEQTTPFGGLEAVESYQPINLGFQGSPPEMSMFTQISVVDYRSVNAPILESGEKGVVQLQLADGGGGRVGDWIKLSPFINVYDQQGTDNYTNCLFDPIDDGNDEESFFDQTDPNRRLGFSSMCYPEFSWSWVGDTFTPFSAANIGNASDGPGLEGNLGNGTWVEAKFNLERFRGRRIRLRYLMSGLNNGEASTTYEATFMHNPDPGDDGWWIDNVTISNTLTSPASVTNDDDTPSLSGCGLACNSVTASVATDPGLVLPSPGSALELDATASSATECLNGVLQYRFSDHAGILRDWTDNPIYILAPTESQDVRVDVRCSSLPSCFDAQVLSIDVLCPTSGSLGTGPFPTIYATDKDTLELDGGASIAHLYAEDTDLGPNLTYAGAATGSATAVSHSMAGDAPNPGNAYWYLFRHPGTLAAGNFCNDTTSWGSAARDAALP